MGITMALLTGTGLKFVLGFFLAVGVQANPETHTISFDNK